MEIQHKELTFQRMVEASPAALILVNGYGKIAYLNRSAENMFLYSKEELIGQDVGTLIPIKFRESHFNLLSNYFTMPKNRKMGENRELYALRKDKTEFPVEIGLNTIVTVEGTLVLAAIIDITERKRAEEDFKLYTKRIEEKNKELEQFTYIASHDLREPLNSIIGVIEFILEVQEYKDNNELYKLLQFIDQSTSRMQALVSGLLDYTRIGKKAELIKVDLNHLVQVVLEDLGLKLKESSTKVTVDTLPTIFIYELEFRLLLQNLITNAVKYCKKNVPPEINISAERKKTAWEFQVKDNGIGIPHDQYKKIFLLFQRLHDRDKYDGIGIGLAHCKKIVELHDGEIWVESEPGRGSTFYFTIPFKKSNYG